MILLDTNVVSEPLCPAPAAQVIAWIDAQPLETLFLFDMACTKAHAELLARVRAAGRSIATADACIAAIAIANGLVVATRDTSPFQAAGLVVINPWDDR